MTSIIFCLHEVGLILWDGVIILVEFDEVMFAETVELLVVVTVLFIETAVEFD